MWNSKKCTSNIQKGMIKKTETKKKKGRTNRKQKKKMSYISLNESIIKLILSGLNTPSKYGDCQSG